ncbi:MAG: FAD binding domain-containing protein [Syntrophales bacterium]|nr:FAD binding domain-containing protein [Syntrophales bacterium]
MTHAQLLGNALVREHLPILVNALRTLGSPLIRNMGTIGGNICTASPAGDTLPPLYALDAELELRSRKGERRQPLCTFITGPGGITLGEGEILTGIRVRKPCGFTIHHFEKVGERRSLACAIASMAALIKVTESGVIEAARLAWGSVAPTVVMSPETEGALIGQRLSAATLERAAEMIRKAVSPIDDVRASAAYRREVAGNLLLRLA